MVRQRGTSPDARAENLPVRLAMVIGVIVVLALLFSAGIREALAERVAPLRATGAAEVTQQ